MLYQNVQNATTENVRLSARFGGLEQPEHADNRIRAF